MKWIRDKFVAKWYSVECFTLGQFASICSPFGLWPLEKDNVFLRIRWCISTFFVILIVLQAIYDSYLNCVNIENNGDNLYSVTFGTVGLFKMIFYYKYRDVLRTNVESAFDDWASKDSKNFRPMMGNYRREYTKVTKYFLIVGSCVALMWVIKVLFIDSDVTIIVKSADNSKYGNMTTALKQRFLLPVSCTFNDASPFLFRTIIAIQLFQFSIVTGVNLCCDGFFIAITSHLCVQLEILKIKFATFPNLINETEIQEKFGILIDRHAHLLKLAEQLQNSFSIIIFTQISMNVGIWNVGGFNFLVLYKKREMMSALTNASIMQFTMFQTFVNCYIGDWLASQGEELAQSVYNCRWYFMKTKVSKNVIFIMTRTRRPIGLTAGNFIKMKFSTFTTTVKTAASYLSVLRILITDS